MSDVAGTMVPMRDCVVEGCSGKAGVPGTARGYCHAHWNRYRRHGDPLAGGTRNGTPAVDRVLARSVVDENGCLVWTGNKDRNGYGTVRVNGKGQRVHRVVWIAAGRDLPDGLTIDHLCFNPSCVNIDHMEAVTLAENIRRMNIRRWNQD